MVILVLAVALVLMVVLAVVLVIGGCVRASGSAGSWWLYWF